MFFKFNVLFFIKLKLKYFKTIFTMYKIVYKINVVQMIRLYMNLIHDLFIYIIKRFNNIENKNIQSYV